MSIKDDIVDTIRKVLKQNPWIPYEGPAGGQGWMNQMTGEVRYQENRPDPGEGMPEDVDPEQIPEAEDVPETLEPLSEEELLAQHLEEGDEITIDLMDAAMEEVQHEGIEAEIVYGSDSEYGPNVEYNHPESGTVESHQISWEEVADHPAELEPTEGWADGWTDAPRDHLDLETDQTVEIYDFETGEYVEGEVLDVDDWGEDGSYLRVQTEDREYEFLDGELQQGGDAMLTAAEDIYPPVEPPEEFSVGEFTEGEEVLYWNGVENEVRRGEIDEILSNEVRIFEPEMDGYLYIGEDSRSFIFDEEMEREFELQAIDTAPIEEIPGALESAGVVAGGYAIMDHPVFGEVEGDVEVTTDDHGYDWLTVEAPVEEEVDVTPGDEEPEMEDVDPQDLEVGDLAVFHGGAGPNMVGEIDGFVDDEVVSVYFGEEVGVSQMNLDSALGNPTGEGVTMEEASLTTNPEHPFYVGDHMEEIEDPWTTVSDADEIQIGDTVMYEGHPASVGGIVGEEPHLDLHENHTYTDTFVDAAEFEEVAPADMPEPPVSEDWQDPLDIGDYNPGDTVAFYDPGTGQIEVDEVETDHGDGEMTLDEAGLVDVDWVAGYDDTGEVQLPGDDDLHYATPGDYVEVAYVDEFNESLEYVRGWVSEHNQMTGETAIITEDGGRTRIDAGTIVDEPDPPSDYMEWQDATAEEIAADIAADVKLESPGSHMIRGEIRPQLMRRHNPAAVTSILDKLTNNEDGWKRFSNRSKAGTWDQALKRASGSNRPARDGPSPTREEIRVAETIHELSKQRWRENPPEHVYRGLSDTGAASLFSSVLEDPFTADEYEISMLATNNFSEKRGTAENLGTAPTVIHFDGHQLDPEQVMAYHDDFFHAPNDSENEIALRGDDMRVPRDQFYLNKNTDLNFADPPHEWDFDQARAFRDKLDRYGPGKILHDANVYEHPTRNQLENAIRIERVMREKHDMTTGNFFDDVRETLREEYDVDPDAVTYPELAEQGYGGTTETLPDGITDPADFQSGMEIEFFRFGDRLEGDIIDVREDGTLEVEEYEYGEVYPIEPEDVADVVYSSDFYGPNSDLLGNEEPWDPSVFDQYDYQDVVVSGYGMGNQAEIGTVSQVDGTEVEIFDVGGYDGGILTLDVSDPTEAARIAPLPMTGIDSTQADALEGETVAFEHPETGEFVEGQVDANFPSMDSVAIRYDGEIMEDPVSYDAVAPGDIDWGQEIDETLADLGLPEGPAEPSVGDTVTVEGEAGEIVGYDELNDEYDVEFESGGVAPIPADSIDDESEGPDGLGPDDVEPGMEVQVPHYAGHGPWQIDDLWEDPETGEVAGVRLQNGDVLDFTEIEPTD